MVEKGRVVFDGYKAKVASGEKLLNTRALIFRSEGFRRIYATGRGKS